MTVRRQTTMMAVSITTGLFTSAALADFTSQVDAPTKWVITPTAHTNQDDDDEKRMNINIPMDKELSLTLTNAVDKTMQSLVKMAFLTSPLPMEGPLEFDQNWVEFLSGSAESNPVDPIRGYITPVLDLVEDKYIGDAGGFDASPVPAPGVLGLLAIAGLTARRRSRR